MIVAAPPESKVDFNTRHYVVAPRISSGNRDGARFRAMNLLQRLDVVDEKPIREESGLAVVKIVDDNELVELRREVGDEVLITPLIKYSIARAPIFPTHARQNSLLKLPDIETTRTVRFSVVNQDGNPIAEATVAAFFSLKWKVGVKAVTDINGVAELEVPFSDMPDLFEIVYVYPPHSLWSTYETRVLAIDKTFILESLPEINGYQWWAKILGIEQVHHNNYAGQYTKIAVIDTGVGPHYDLSNVVDGRNFTSDGGSASYEDIDGHGTHVAGIIGASNQLIGIAPATEIYSARVFSEGYADNDDIAEAIEVAVDEWGCDIINLSLGGQYDPLIEDRINYATQCGVFCIAAAGNSGGTVEFPAAFKNSFCISALGRTDTYPNSSIHQEAEPESRGLYGKDKFYAAKFSCNGEQVHACAPGVAIISTVPSEFYAALDGTSMACPMATGVAAILLSKDESLLNTSGHSRVSRLKAQVQAVLQDIYLPRKFQGAGILSL